MTTRLLSYLMAAWLTVPILAPAATPDYDPEALFQRTIAEIDSLMSRDEYAVAAESAISLLDDDRLFQHQRWRLHQRAGLALQNQGRLEEALIHLEKAVIWAQAEAVNHRNLATLMIDMSRSGRAMSEYREACDLDPGNWHYLLEYAHVLIDFGQLDLADRAIENAAAICPDCPEVHHAGSRLALELKDYGRALPHLEILYASRPDDDEVRSLLALARLRNNQADGAVVLLALAWDTGLSDRDMRILLEADRYIGDSARAVQLALSLGDGQQTSYDPLLWAQAALVCIDTGRDIEGLILVDRALALDPANTSYLNNRVLLLRRLGRDDEADRDWTRLIALDPSREQASSETP